MTGADLPLLIDAVQRNCDIADARHAREATLCTYLLQMREYYRWENELPLSAPPPREDLARWLAEREARWSALEGEAYARLPLAGASHDPFDAAGVNRELVAQGLVYGAGYGRFHRPHFFLAQLAREETREGSRVLVSGCEYARDLAAAPAALQGDTIYLRHDALRRWLWEKIELWQARNGESAFGRALACWGFVAEDPASFERLVQAQSEAMILHELGEARAAALLGPGWEEMLAGLEDRREELLARAVRDNLADCLVTLPALFEQAEPAPIHLYFAHFEGTRRELFPALAGAYRAWCEEPAGQALPRAVEAGAAHWERAARKLLAASAHAELRELAL
jgi:hypothetical protein